MTTKLQAVNTLLSGIGQAPVISLDQANPEIAIASNILDQVTREVLGEGWNFNTEQQYPFTPDNNGFIFVPPNVLSLADNKTETRQDFQLVLRDGKLYDKLSHSFVFPVGTPVPCDVVWLFDFEDLPQPFKDYIISRSTRVFAGRTQGSREMVGFNTSDELVLRNNCYAYDTRTAKPNIFGLENGQDFYNSYTPFQTIQRL